MYVSLQDQNQTKKSPFNFFIFHDKFKKLFKEDHPYVKDVIVVGKATTLTSSSILMSSKIV